MLLDNYEIIVKTITEELLKGNLIVKNSSELQGYNIQRLYQLLVDRFLFKTNQVHLPCSFEQGKIIITLPEKAIFIQEVYLDGIGEVISPLFGTETSQIIIDPENEHNLTLDENTVTTCSVKYITFTKSIPEIN